MQSLRCHSAFSGTTRQPVSRTRLTINCKESRIGRAPITVPKDVKVDLQGSTLKVKGPKGELSVTLPKLVTIEQVKSTLLVKRINDSKQASAMHGLSRSLANNLVVGVSTGFEKRMNMVGTGYRASVAGQELTLNVGYSKPRIMAIPAGLKVVVEKNTFLVISGADKVLLGDFCAKVRANRPPEPYKGKGIRYEGEIIKLKEGKSGKKK